MTHFPFFMNNQLRALLFNHRTHLCIADRHSAGMNINSAFYSPAIIGFPSRNKSKEYTDEYWMRRFEFRHGVKQKGCEL